MMKKTENRAAKTVFVMIFAMVLSKGLGLVRNMLMTAKYGIGYEADAFNTASHIPLQFFELLFGAAILGCFIPIYNEFDKEKDRKSADKFAGLFFNFIILLSSLLAVVGIFLAPTLVNFVAKDLDAETKILAIKLLRIMFPMIIFTGSAYTLIGVLQSKGKFILPSLVSSISNLGVIIYFIFIDDLLGKRAVYGLAVAYLISWATQLLTMLIPLYKSGFRFHLDFKFSDPALIRALKMSPKVVIGSWLTPISGLVGIRFASMLDGGAVTVFTNANNTYTIIVGILTYGVCNFIFPKLARFDAQNRSSDFAESVRDGIVSLFYIVIPVMAATLLLSDEIISVLYLRGAFDKSAAMQTSLALKFMGIGMPAFCLIELFSRVMYAKKKPNCSMYSALVGSAANIISTFVLVKFTNLGIAAVTLGNAIGQIAAATMLAFFVFKSSDILSKDLFVRLFKVLICSAACAASVFAAKCILNIDTFSAGFIKSILSAAVCFIVGAVVYLLLCKVFGLKFDLKGDEN